MQSGYGVNYLVHEESTPDQASLCRTFVTATPLMAIFTTEENRMKTRILALSVVLSLASFSGVASAKGCLKGAAEGGVVGHVAGKHGEAGAAAGCAMGHHSAKKKEKQEAAQANATPAQQNQAAPAATK
jgi:hypothetical protein